MEFIYLAQTQTGNNHRLSFSNSVSSSTRSNNLSLLELKQSAFVLRQRQVLTK